MGKSFDFLLIWEFAFCEEKKAGSFSLIKDSDYRKSNPKDNNRNSLLQVYIQ
jgi:hypothetical protein